MSHKPTVLFDLDGTLIDSTHKALIGLPSDEIFLKLGIESERGEEFAERYKERYKSVLTMTNLLLGAEDVVKKGSFSAKLGIVTTKTALYSKEILRCLIIVCFK